MLFVSRCRFFWVMCTILTFELCSLECFQTFTFVGQMALTRVEADENLKAWFSNLAQDVQSFEFGESMTAGNVAGRKIQNTIAALQDLER